MALVNLALLAVCLGLLWRSWRCAAQTGSVASIWSAMFLLLASCYYLVQFIVSLAG